MLYKTFGVQCGAFSPQGAVLCSSHNILLSLKLVQSAHPALRVGSSHSRCCCYCFFLFCNNNLTLARLSLVQVQISSYNHYWGPTSEKDKKLYHSSQHSQKIKGRQVKKIIQYTPHNSNPNILTKILNYPTMCVIQGSGKYYYRDGIVCTGKGLSFTKQYEVCLMFGREKRWRS